ncbi:MAG: pyruvate kinase [Agathobacter sp.]|nr:pyruvate kinase [Agathobacter sp.]
MRTKIFGTFGPACASEEKLVKMIEVGMTGMRLNLSHTMLSASENYIRNYQSAAAEAGVTPQILIDMQGPELRIGKLENPVELSEGEKVLLGAADVSENTAKIPVPEEVMEVIQTGDEILLDDGKLLVQVEEAVHLPEEKMVVVRVQRGGILHSHKSVKIVGKNIKLPPLTEHDIENIKVAKAYGVTALMQPFVLSGEDLRYVRHVLKEHGAEDVQIFAKIENRLGVENLENILPEADVIIIARGDLGNDMPLWELPKVQKEIEAVCKKAKKPYIVVTQMLASMERNPVPTRAEVSDIFHAVYHGAWGVMLTGETAVGNYPVEAVQYLANTAKETEKYIG